ncbi:MAG: DUF2267 domain-containing protein [Gemmatimonadales bacterium]|nr:MAG: DUF2267 domain-containing protein [Gemmatimonadales bacterium]
MPHILQATSHSRLLFAPPGSRYTDVRISSRHTDVPHQHQPKYTTGIKEDLPMSEHLTVPQLRRATQQTQEWLKELATYEPLQVEEQAYSYLRAVLHAIRDRLTVTEASHLAQQLPMMVRGFYYEGWRPSLAPFPIESKAEFLEQVRSSLGGTTTDAGEVDVHAGTMAVLSFLQERLQEGTLRHVKQQLPEELVEMFQEAVLA